MTLSFYVRFSTKPGQSLHVTGEHAALGNNDTALAIQLQYFNEQFWHGKVEVPYAELKGKSITYHYILQGDEGEVAEWGNDRIIDIPKSSVNELVMIDTWNHAGDLQNVYFTKPFQEVLLKQTNGNAKPKALKSFSHEFKVKAPVLNDGEVVCMAGIGKELNDWSTENPLLLAKKDNWWTIRLDLTDVSYPIAYKYGIYNTKTNSFQSFETGNNRTLPINNAGEKHVLIHDGFVQVNYPLWKGAGVAIPVFSLRSANSFGTGEFADIKLLVDWAKQTGLKVIQLLPINDTTATNTYLDSYPYAAISAFALHPLYLNLEKIAGAANKNVLKGSTKQKLALNASATVEYEEVMKIKITLAKELFELQKEALKNDPAYFEFFELNRHWLVPYAAFSFLRDKNKTADYNQWKKYSVFDEAAIQKLVAPSQKHYDAIAFYYFIQYHLHLQLKDATAYAHKNGFIVKGDLPIGIYRYGCDAWMAPDLYNMDAQAGAPPDDFAIKGQNWGFPTYNWKKMQEDGFAWWRQRFEQMSYYFDAFRIDHILGFFRIWSIPLNAVEGILGRFVPAIPVHLNEFFRNGISFQHHRYCKPYITDKILWQKFGTENETVKDLFLTWNGDGFDLKPEFDTQKKVEAYFDQSNEQSTHTDLYRTGLYDLISNVILLQDESSAELYHFRINMMFTSSYLDLDDYSKQKLYSLYVDYFYRRQDQFWKDEAMTKLPELKRSTNMLICGEDLGMVPDCVPDVMNQLGILSLEIQRMPKDPNTTFFHPANAPYLSVVTPSTHDMSTIRGWWEEDPEKTQSFYNNVLGHYGNAPYFCEAWINREIILQHLYSPAMWSIFQLQDLLGMSNELRRSSPQDERINVPADPKHFWRYRMHMNLEDLIKEQAFNAEVKNYVVSSGRALI